MSVSVQSARDSSTTDTISHSETRPYRERMLVLPDAFDAIVWSCLTCKHRLPGMQSRMLFTNIYLDVVCANYLLLGLC